MTETNQVWVIDDDRSIDGFSEGPHQGRDAGHLLLQRQCVIKALDRGQPEAIISDVRMPGMDGFTLEKIKQAIRMSR